MGNLQRGGWIVSGALGLAALVLGGCAHPLPPGTCSAGALRVTLSAPGGGEVALPPDQRQQVMPMWLWPDLGEEVHGTYRCEPTGTCRSVTVDPKLQYMALPQNMIFYVRAADLPPEGMVVRADFKVLERPVCTPEF